MKDRLRSPLSTALIAVVGICSPALAAPPISVVPYASVGPSLVDFEDVSAAPFPGVVYDGVLVSGGVSFAERFAGQTLSFNGNNDVLSGTPTSPLALQTGAAGQNLDVGIDNGTHDLIPCGFLGCSNPDGYGEGSFAILFPGAVSQFGFQDLGANGGSTTVEFFRGNGTLIASLSVTAGGSFGFMRDGGVKDIAGVSIFTDDAGGLGYDNIKFDAPAAFDVCLQDDKTVSVLQFSSTTGSYRFCCKPTGATVTGTGTISTNTCYVRLLDSQTTRTVTGEFQSCAKRGSASLKTNDRNLQCSVYDHNTTDDTCTCP